MQVRMEARVLVMRVLHDAKTSVIVQVLHSNAVLKCEVMQDSTKNLGEGQTATNLQRPRSPTLAPDGRC